MNIDPTLAIVLIGGLAGQCPKTLWPSARASQGSSIDPRTSVSGRQSRRRARCLTLFPLGATNILDFASLAAEPHGVKTRAEG